MELRGYKRKMVSLLSVILLLLCTSSDWGRFGVGRVSCFFPHIFHYSNAPGFQVPLSRTGVDCMVFDGCLNAHLHVAILIDAWMSTQRFWSLPECPMCMLVLQCMFAFHIAILIAAFMSNVFFSFHVHACLYMAQAEDLEPMAALFLLHAF